MKTKKFKINRFFIVVTLLVLSVSILSGCFFKPTKYRGYGYSVRFPQGWSETEFDFRLIPFKGSVDESTIVTWVNVAPTRSGKPNHTASFSVSTLPLLETTWIEDESSRIKRVLVANRFKVLDHGPTKLEQEDWYWFLYQDLKKPVIYLEYLFVDHTNLLYSIQYRASAKHFNKFRDIFETFKNSFKFSFLRY